jgi:flagellar protein FlgJ
MITPIDNSSSSLAIDAKGVENLKQAARQNSPEALKGAAKQFEALFMNMMMKSMRDATPQDGMFDSQQSRMYTSMLDQQISQNLASRGIGLADMLIRQLSGNNMVNGTVPVEGAASPAQASNPFAARAGQAGAADDDVMQADPSQPAHVQAFRQQLAAHAQEASRTTGIPAKFMLGQAALESGWGKHVMRTADGGSSHNLFGIKAGAGWKGKTVAAVTTEYVDGVAQKRVEKFRAYDSYADSFRDYAKLLSNNPRYQDVLANASDAKSFAQGLQRAGYATDPHYAAKLTNIINNNLSSLS